MAKKEFNLGDSLAGILGSVSPSDTEEQIEYIPLQNLVSDERNFYSMDGVEELAANIELIGLQQPLRVLKGENGFYVIVSGHRRAAALRLLAEEAPEKWARVPCIVEKPGASPELEELRLIMANADTRRMSSADMAKQAERVETLLYELKEQGYEFQGRMRDHVAEACKVSATKLAELKVIRERLAPDWRRLWEENKINHSTAYTIAKEDPDIQRRLAYEYTPLQIESWAQWQVENAIEFLRNPPQPKEKPADPISDFDPTEYAAQLARETALLREAIRDHFHKELCSEVKRNVCNTRMAAIDQLKRAFRTRGFSGPRMFGYGGKPNGLEIKTPDNERFLARWADVFDQLALLAIEEWSKTAPLPPEKWTPAWISVDERYPDEGEYCLVCTASRVVLPAVYFRASFMDFTEKSVGNVRIQRVEHWMPLPKAPGKFKYMGQETLDSLTNRG